MVGGIMGLGKIWESNKVVVKKRVNSNHWSDEDIRIMKEMWNEGFSKRDISERLGRSFDATRVKFASIGMKNRENVRVWSKDKTNKLKQIYKDFSDRELSEILGVTEAQVLHKRIYENLKKWKMNKWTKQEIDFLKENHDMEKNELSDNLKRTVGSIKAKLRNLREKGEL